MLKLVAFDCDGVLFDSREANIAFYNAILAKFNRPPMDPERVDYVHSRTFRESLEYLFGAGDHLAEVLAFCRTLSYQPFIPMMVEAPYLRDFLTFLRPRFFTAVATNRTTTTHPVLSFHGLDKYFDLVVSALDVTHPKPHPESFWRILRHFRVEPEEAIYIGDSHVDEEFAHNAGVALVAYRNPNLKAAYYLESFAQGPALIQSLTGVKSG
jgi:HAD superfamily hydrolase (TIGR01509 family)|uniref:phosphoglycolate phosphatase n=1 Tax=Desulfobacca acetoxidans TaxID=60893 RepID=A0A7C3WGM3_9BACT